MASPGQPAWSFVDDESLNLILSLQREDASRVRSASKGKQAKGILSDADLALQLHAEELERATGYTSDRRMAKSAQSAIQTDTTTLLESEWQESVARRDREIAVAQSAGQPQERTQTPVNTGLSATELETWENLTSKYITGTDEAGSEDSFCDGINTPVTETDGQPESQFWVASRGQNESHGRPCIACGEVKDSVSLARVPCEHHYCSECLEHLFRSAMLDESLFPPRCCHQNIPVYENRMFLSNDLVEQFMQKSIELATLNKTGRHPTRSTTIPPSMTQDGIAQCPECKAQVCEICKKTTHRGCCPSDTGDQQILGTPGRERQQSRSKYTPMIELNTGRCRTTCKTCTCIHRDEPQLSSGGEKICNRDHNADDKHVHVKIANHYHECDHERRVGRGELRECEERCEEMPILIHEGCDCGLMACRRCRYNRL
ncbi:hypothetical protein F5Y12DRAFT_782432 [Xylaria sp. FL1777]|nr:hypothetical protein F5Y12DRAFT_782432 [Xylaria sp. FL1777]